MSDATVIAKATAPGRPPRLGFLGAGPSARDRMRAIAASGVAEVAAVADPSMTLLHELEGIVPGAVRLGTLDELLRQPLDGIVITRSGAPDATPALRALEAGIPAFCQPPLAATTAATRAVIAVARRANLRLGVDLPYRCTEAMRVLRSVVQAGELGDVYAIDLVFHGAGAVDGPRDPALPDAGSDAGCVVELGAQVIDLALWTLGFPRVTSVRSRRYARGELLPRGASVPEDYAAALLELDTGATMRLACSWNLPTGRQAVIEVSFYGTDGGGSFRNVPGSASDFTAELHRGTSRHPLASPPDAWRGRAALDWARDVALGARYDPWIEGLIDVASAVDALLE